MENEEMQEALETAHNFYVEREKGAVGKAAWWIEYVCRNKGAAVLQSIGEKVPAYQYHHLDVLLFVLTILATLVGLLVVTCRLCCRCCRRSNKQKKD